MRSHFTPWLSAALLIAALATSGKAIYLTGKATVAQYLLQRAWGESIKTGEPVKPWPWADITPMAVIHVPRLSVEQVALNGHSGEALAFGPGLVTVDDALFFAGHRDSHFAFLRDLTVGDDIVVKFMDGVRRFQVVAAQPFDSRRIPALTLPRRSLTLVTCYPFDAANIGGPGRYRVVALPKT